MGIAAKPLLYGSVLAGTLASAAAMKLQGGSLNEPEPGQFDDVHVRRAVRWSSDHTIDSGDAVLPEIPGQVRSPITLMDSLGDAVRDNHRSIAAAGLIGGAVGVTRGASLLGHAGRGVAGIGVGLLAATSVLTGASALERWKSDDAARDAVEGRPVAGSGVARPGEQLKVMNLNLREIMGDVGTTDTQEETWAKVEALIEREDPDIVLLQEVADFSPLSGFGDQVSEFERRVKPTDSAWAPAMNTPFGMAKGNAVLTFNGATIDDARSIELSDVHAPGTTLRRIGSLVGFAKETQRDVEGFRSLPDKLKGHHSRNVTDALVRTPEGNLVRAVSAHLAGAGVYTGGDPDGGLASQVGPVADALDSWDGPTVIAGDFNTASTQEEAYESESRQFAKAGLADTFTTLGIPLDDARRGSYIGGDSATNPRPIDRLYASSSMDVRSSRVIRDVEASDHLAIVSELVVR